jgi:predicted nucleic acid-binding Zn ribbon protein
MRDSIIRRTEFQSLGSVIKEYLKEKKFDRKLAEVDAVNSWESIIGRQIARSTSSIYIKNETLFVHLKSSIIRQELLMMRSDIIRTINRNAGFDLIKNIVLK